MNTFWEKVGVIFMFVLVSAFVIGLWREWSSAMALRKAKIEFYRKADPEKVRIVAK